MAPHPKVASAMGAMKELGFSWETAKPVLKELLRVYDNNWDHIEAENYRVLADAILDSLGFGDGGLMENKKHYDEDDVEHASFNRKRKPEPDQGVRVDRGPIHEPELDKKKLRTRMQEISSSQSVCSSDSQIGQPARPFIAEKSRQIISAQPSSTYNRSYVDGKDGNALTRMLGTSSVGQHVCTNSFRKGDKDKQPAHKVLDRSLSYDDPKNDYKMKVPATVINRPSGYGVKRLSSQSHQQLASHYNTSKRIGSSMKIESAQTVGMRRGKENTSNDIGKNALTNVDRSCQDLSSFNVEIASSDSGEVRLMFHCNPAIPCPSFQMPSMHLLCKLVEDRYLKSFRILEPGLSLLSLLKEMCHCVIELSSKSAEEQGNIVRVVPVLESLKKTGLQDMIRRMNPLFPNSRSDYMDIKVDPNNRSGTCNDGNDARSSGPVPNDSLSLVVFQQPENPSSNLRTLAVCDDNDICRGEENVKISLANEPSAERYPPSFHYIPRNIVYQNAYVNISLARIGDEDCCSTCSGDCLAASIPCPCARETGGDYAYTSEGLMKMEFLDSIISMKRDQQKEHLYLCKDCPIERIKDEMMPEPCKGHLIRKFVKECWSKCGCNRICGNRLVQRGITRNLQVFWTTKGKGWGLRTLEELPRGAYICEYVGEILTNTELYDRQLHVTGKMRHTYPVLLDADWGSEQVLKDEEALCLDATFYGNVARFINHRCADANIVEVPVEVETPDHHYYHLAFFTVRKVEALEELTWDYGIDFDDHTHPVEAFPCRCGSKFCRGRPQTRK